MVGPRIRSNNRREIRYTLDLAHAECTEGGRTYEIRTEEAEICSVTYDYDDDTPRVMVVDSNRARSDAWTMASGEACDLRAGSVRCERRERPGPVSTLTGRWQRRAWRAERMLGPPAAIGWA